MKRRELIQLLTNKGWWLDREGGNHSVFTDGKVKEYIPRHNELKERLAMDIIKRHSLKK